MSGAADPGKGPIIIEPVDFRTTQRPRRRGRTLRRWATALLGLALIAGLCGAGWFVLTARQVQLTFEPPPQQMQLLGPLPRLRIAQHHLLRPGTYSVNASVQGYHPVQESFVVGAEKNHSFHFEFAELPGIVTLRCVGAQDPGTPLHNVAVQVDGRSLGETPLEGLELASGTHALQLQHERYQLLETDIHVEGLGRQQDLTLQLCPDWADLEIETRPVSAQLWIDGRSVTTTPCRVEVRSGERQLALKAEGFETWQRRIVIVPEQAVSLTDIVLAPAKGRLTVKTVPPGAQIMIDGQFAGTSPIEVDAEPNRDLLIQAARTGYEPAQQTIRLEPQQTATVALELTPQLGTIRLQVMPDDALLRDNGQMWGAVPQEITLPAVEHRLEFTREGFVTATRTVKPRPGVTLKLTVTLESLPSAATAGSKEWTAANGYPFILIGPARYTMGSSRSEPGRRSNETLRTIQLTRPFYIGTREVTNGEYRAFKPEHRAADAGNITLDDRDQPVVQVTWDDAARFCNWLSARDHLPSAYVERDGRMQAAQPMTAGYRLPTEAEWEYVARFNGSDPLLKYPWGSDYPPPDKSGNYADESAGKELSLIIPGYEDGHAGPAPVASYQPSDLGLYDLGGNVAEWCHDFHSIYPYDGDKVYTDPTGPDTGRHHVVRGSGWRHASSSTLRFSYRDYSVEPRDDLGFRICRSLDNAEASNAD